MKKVNIISSSFPPEVSGGSNRVASIAKMFQHNAYEVNVITLGEKNEKFFLGEGLHVHYLKKHDISNVGFVKRALLEISDTFKLSKKSNALKSDINIVSIPYMFLLPIYALFGESKNSIIDVRDIVWEYLPNRGIHKFIKKFITVLMYQSLKRFKSISVTNTHEKNLIEKHLKNSQITIVHNGIDKEKYELFSNLERKNKDSKKTFVISYIGCIGLAQHLMTFIKAIETLNHPNILVNIVGTGNKKNELEDYVKEHQIENIIFHGQKPWKELKDIYANTNVLYAQLTKDYDSAVPSKLYEYASTGIPIIYGGIGESEKFISQLDNAICIEPNNIEILMTAIQKLKQQHLIDSTNNQILIKEKFVRERINLKFLDLI